MEESGSKGVIFQDDTGRVSRSVQQAQTGNTKLDAVFEEKGLEAHPDKSALLFVVQRNIKAGHARAQSDASLCREVQYETRGHGEVSWYGAA